MAAEDPNDGDVNVTADSSASSPQRSHAPSIDNALSDWLDARLASASREVRVVLWSIEAGLSVRIEHGATASMMESIRERDTDLVERWISHHGHRVRRERGRGGETVLAVTPLPVLRSS